MIKYKPKGDLKNNIDFGGKQLRGDYQVHESNKLNYRLDSFPVKIQKRDIQEEVS